MIDHKAKSDQGPETSPEPPQRLGRDKLKQFLSSDALRIPRSSFKNSSNLSDTDPNSQLSPMGSPRKLSTSLVKLSAKDKFIQNLIAAKKAKKSFLAAFRTPKTQHNDQGQSPERLSIVEDFKAFFTEGRSEKLGISNLLHWLDTNITSTALFKFSEKDFFEKESEYQASMLLSTEKFLKNALDKFMEIIKNRNPESALLLNKIFVNYQNYWEILMVSRTKNLEKTLATLTRDLEKQKSDFSNLAKKAKQKILMLKKRLKDATDELSTKDLEIENLSKFSEKDPNKKQAEDYEKIVKNLKKKIADHIVTFKAPNPKTTSKDKDLSKTILSEFQILEKFKLFLPTNKKTDSPEPTGLSQSTQTTIETSDKETMLNFVYFNAETQTYYMCTDNQSQEATQEVEEEIKSLQQAGYIPAGAEIASWSAGYYTGLARGRTIAQTEFFQAEELQDLQENDYSFGLSEDEDEEDSTKAEKQLNNLKQAIKKFEKESEDPEANEPFVEDNGLLRHEDEYFRVGERRETVMRRIGQRKKTTVTQFKEFNFQKREKIVMPKKMKSKKVRELIMKKPIHDLEKRKKMSKKMLVKIINMFYFSLIKSEEIPEDLLEYVYSEYEIKNSMKKVVRRKVIDFLANLIQNSNILKIKTFLKFLKLEKRIKESPFFSAKDCLSVYLSGFDSIHKSKLGFMPDFNDFSETNLVPAIRVSEFYKEQFSDNHSPARMLKLFDFIEKNSVFDKKRLNKSGVIDLEAALDFAIQVYEEHLQRIKFTGELIIKALTCENNPECIRKTDLIFVASLLKPGIVFKEFESLTGEFLTCEEVFSSGLKEIFPEEFIEGPLVTYEENLNLLEQSAFFTELGYTNQFKQLGESLDTSVQICIQKIVELYNKNTH